ncbi:snapalysin [Kibdelosporangium banguiense]|uniref:Extracellular small neutral protease n=1 Tax=Kibdelosporangium banguiense TaxID=1365924 RepID=A0ABS4TVU9_9PSEU|nr:snapalysin family zinc-dependent metalloprotease [Kibdelosporangium banguiense]MBP2328085.1 snapalysin [Kibdelosporangium banguiense]
MLRRTFSGVLTGAALIVPMVVAAPSATAAVDAQAATTLTYDDSQAAEFKSAAAAAVRVWNANVKKVRIVKAKPGQRVNIRVIADEGWPSADLGPVRTTGTVKVWIGREAVADGYDKVRIVAHEMGHSLGLDDAKPGPCSSLMSGSTGGVSCKNTRPNAAERAEVERNYSGKASSASRSVVVVEAAY